MSSVVGDLPFPLEERRSLGHVEIVVPIYNEAAVLEFFAARLGAVLDRVNVSSTILFVSDGSTDDTVSLLESLAGRDRRVRYLCLSRNFGHQAALSAGLDRAQGDIVVTMDGDLQHPPELLPRMIELWRQGYDVVHTRKVSTEGLSVWRRVVTKLAYRAIRRVAQVEIIPEASDFRLIDRAALDALMRLPERQRLYRGLTRWIGFRQAVVPYEAESRGAGSSRYGIRQLLQLFSRSFFDFSNAPLHVGIVLGLMTIASCACYVAFTVAAYLTGHQVPHGYVTIIFLIVLLSSINLTFSGILGVYLARVYDEVRGRPTYVIGHDSIAAAHEATTAAEARRDLDHVRPL